MVYLKPILKFRRSSHFESAAPPYTLKMRFFHNYELWDRELTFRSSCKGKPMRRFPVKLVCFFLIFPLSMLLFGCSPAKPTANPDLVWSVSLSKFEVKDKLESVETVAQYVGSTQQLHQQYPAKGNVYLIMKVTVSKQGTATAPFDWSKLTVQDNAGTAYPRNSNDTFLEQYNYTPRMTGLVLQLGENEGWICYEIPAQAANGMLTLTYSGAGSQQEIVVKK
jgi:hypothetical protein